MAITIPSRVDLQAIADGEAQAQIDALALIVVNWLEANAATLVQDVPLEWDIPAAVTEGTVDLVVTTLNNSGHYNVVKNPSGTRRYITVTLL